MDIVEIRQNRRESKIRMIQHAIIRAFDADVNIYKDKLLVSCMSKFHTNRRTTLEYISIALDREHATEDAGIIMKDLSKVEVQYKLEE